MTAYQELGDNINFELMSNINDAFGTNIFDSSKPIRISESNLKREQEIAERQERLSEAERKAQERLAASKSPNFSSPPPPTLHDVGNSMAHSISNLRPSKGIGMAAIAIAGALTLSGYANGGGGQTSSSMPTPAETQATGSSESEQMRPPINPPVLSDNNLNVMRGASNKSYVINVSANSPQGRNAAESAISRATQNAVPQNTTINISSNISYNDRLDSLYLNNVIENMFA